MQCNAGKVDRIARVVLGIALIAWAFLGGVVWGYIGIVPLVTGLIGFCPLYSILKLDTRCERKE